MVEPAAGGDLDGAGTRRPVSYGRRRAAVLAAVYVLIAVHVVHWKLAGKTLAPLELHEVMYTLELGIVTAGFLFMCSAALSVAVFGRFFCSWGCHVLALEDLCSWLLAKLRIRPRPIRSRVLLLVAPGAAFYMFVYPQLGRILSGRPPPRLRILSDAEGWASFTTTDFWRNLPGPWITVLTLAICGFAIVYFLGSRGFCTYACPYGVIFGAIDRFAPGRIRAVGDCVQCATCTAQCQSRVRVHEEIAAFGRVVDPSCLKDLDCVAACPHGVLAFGFTRPAFFQSLRRARKRPIPYHFSAGEDVLMAATFVASLLVLRGLYDAVPFLMTLGIGCILAYLAVVGLRLVRRDEVRLNNFPLKRAARLTPSGRVFAVVAAITVVFMVHSAVIRYHEFRGGRAFEALEAGTGARPDPALAERARHHLEAAERWGLVSSPRLLYRLASVHYPAGSPAAAESYLRRILSRQPENLEATQMLGTLLADGGRFPEAAAQLQAARRLRPDSAPIHYNLAVVLGQMGREADAIAAYRMAIRLAPDDPQAHNNLAFLLLARGLVDAAEPHFRRALEAHPDFAAAHFNLARLLMARGRTAEAIGHFEHAARLDPRYGEAGAAELESSARR